MTKRSTDRRKPSGRRIRQIRQIRLLSVLGAGLFGLLMALIPAPASAHGATVMPGSRTYLCYLDLLENSSTQMPDNPACAAAVQQGGTGPLYNWFAVLDSNGGGRTTGYVPDGTLCSGGNRGPFNFAAYNAVRSDWPKTHLTSGSSIELRHSNWAHHPGRFDVYITKSGWSPSQQLAWGDLEKISSVTDPPQRGSVGSDAGHYYWNVQLPQRSGQHILYVHWIRSDSQENFYSCSDIVFDGGNGEVTYGSGQTMSAEQVADSFAPAVQDAQATHAAHAAQDGASAHAGHAAGHADASRAASDLVLSAVRTALPSWLT
ncbi:lytic polysaccharide monooxygenase auxiliary activity family 9 protein [Streptomyces sp. 6N223]|uniref:lytic polysaccharide monooxygenase auxiliary activity family 9 protein n=1 Tax=Streptomyces sp. 6N223 TaxID=3457412 RepID=UPI003FD6731C